MNPGSDWLRHSTGLTGCVRLSPLDGLTRSVTSLHGAPCELRGCKDRALSVSWQEVVKGIPNQGVDCVVSYGSFFLFLFCVSGVCIVMFDVFGCQYQWNWLPGKTRLRNDLLCVEWDVRPYTFIHPTAWPTGFVTSLDGLTGLTGSVALLDGLTGLTGSVTLLDGLTDSVTSLDGLTGLTDSITPLGGLTGFVALLDGLTFTTAISGILVELQQLQR